MIRNFRYSYIHASLYESKTYARFRSHSDVTLAEKVNYSTRQLQEVLISLVVPKNICQKTKPKQLKALLIHVTY